MTQRRWLRIVPIALIMYTISYIDPTNIALALEPKNGGCHLWLEMTQP